MSSMNKTVTALVFSILLHINCLNILGMKHDYFLYPYFYLAKESMQISVILHLKNIIPYLENR